ncbi:MAG: hypothetical protein AABX71_02815 [Nanoarchaeota archaeon]
MISKKKTRKAQEEMVGFVLIVVLVAIIALIFLGISMRKTTRAEENKEIDSFLASTLLFTTNCRPSADAVYDFKDLIRACLKNERCDELEKACDVLNKTAFNLIENSWKISEESREKAYIFRIYKGEESLVYLAEGKESSKKQGAEIYLPVEGENVYLRMEIFY